MSKTDTSTTMESSWLVQRLKKPQTGRAGKIGEVFAFGGGLKNGGLNDEAMGLLRGIFSFDYMGAAEFEFGAVPAALNRIAKSASGYTAFSFAIPLAQVQKHWKDRSKTPLPGEATVYVLCRATDDKEVTARIRGWAAEDFGGLKEATRLASALNPVDEWDAERCGWLELDNGFFFFTDREMWAATARLFGVEVSS